MEHQTENKVCQNCKEDFSIESEDFVFYERMKVPAPHVCPDCRFKMRAMFRNEMTLYSGQKCDLCQKNIISMYSSKSIYKKYCYHCFYSEKWDPREYFVNYDFSRPFFDQLKDLLVKVPKICMYLTSAGGENINSEYVNMGSGCKNCYLIFNSGPAEDVMYSRGVKDVRDSCDMYFGSDFDRCYDSINIQKSSGVLWGQNAVGCVDSSFIINGSGLTDCFGCVNLRNKSYCFLNKQLTSDEYKKTVKEIMGSHEKIEAFKKEFYKFALEFPRRENNNLKVVASKGDYLFECKNVSNSFEVTKGEDSRHIFFSKDIKDSLGTIGHGVKAERLLECVATGHSSNIIGSYGLENSQDVSYSFYVENCQDCIGCDSLKNGKYCILNKQYSKDEYEKIRDHIIGELKEKNLYGLMMPPDLAPFAYNETIAQDNMPMSKEDAISLGFRWEDDVQITKGKETLNPESIPDNIDDVSDNIKSEVLRCVGCTRNYKITDAELLFYRKMKLPIPRYCFYCRHKDRLNRRGPYKFWNRECDFCGDGITTTYAPDRPERVYCEKCYQKEVL